MLPAQDRAAPAEQEPSAQPARRVLRRL